MSKIVVKDSERLSCNTKEGRVYAFTLNNWTSDDEKSLEEYFLRQKDCKFGWGYEIGDEKKTPHLQGWVSFSTPKKFETLHNKFPKIHWEQTKKSLIANIKYCQKSGKYHSNEKKSLHEKWTEHMNILYNNIKWKQWQKYIIELCESKPDMRTIYWIYDFKGNIGKTHLGKFLDWKYDAIIVNGKTADVFNEVKNYVDKNDDSPKVVIADIPRENIEFLQYSTLEKLKDGLFYSGKYEGGKLRLLPLHLFVFANTKPIKGKMSKDRIKQISIKKNEESDSDSDDSYDEIELE